MTQIDQVIIEMGAETKREFREHCEPDDWEEFPIAFRTPFPEGNIRVVVTANDLDVHRGSHKAAVVGLVQELNSNGFKLSGRNSDCARGAAGFNWIAVMETPGRRAEPRSVRMGVVQARSFAPDCNAGDWQSWGVNYSRPLERAIVVLTASNLNVRHTAAAVGIVQNPASDAFTLAARNSDCAGGDCAFYYAAVSRMDEGNADMFVDSGEVGEPLSFSEDCRSGDWQSWDVQFHGPFSTPPVVLVTGNDRGVRGHNAAVVGIAQNVTPYGFTLAARNSDCARGQAGFYWVAFGCGKGCG